MLVVAAIVAVIAAFAVPGYLNFVIQTKVSGLWQQAEESKLAVESKFLKQNQAVASITVDSGTQLFTTTNVDFVKCITIQGGVVSVVGDPSKFNDKSIWIAWQPTTTSGTISWACLYSADAAPYVTDLANTCTESATTYFTADAACI